MTSPAAPIDPDLVAAALVAAAETLNVDPAGIVIPPAPRDGSSRVRVLAGAAIVSRGWHPCEASAAVCVNRIQLCPSHLVRVELTAALLAATQARLDERGAAFREPELRRNAKGWKDPRRDLVRETLVVKMREAGEGPKAIADAVKLSLSGVNTILTRCGKTFTPLKRGRPAGSPQVGGRPKGSSAVGGRRPTDSAAPPSKAQREVRPSGPRPARKAVAVAAPPKAAPVEAIEAFPADHPVWRPLEGSTPILLIHHEKGCRWSVEVADAKGPMVCNGRLHGATPYCEPHAWLGASPAIRSTMVRPVARGPEVRVAQPFSDRDLQPA